VLYKAPQAIYANQQNIYNLRQTNQLLEAQIQQIRQIFSLLAMGQQLWLRYFVRLRSK
jgi:Ca2+-binding EF-hand superfamily protein